METVTLRILHAYNPSNGLRGEGKVGGEHLAATAALSQGRLRRLPGDPLCKPAHAFFELRDHNRLLKPVICKRCLEVARRLERQGAALRIEVAGGVFGEGNIVLEGGLRALADGWQGARSDASR